MNILLSLGDGYLQGVFKTTFKRILSLAITQLPNFSISCGERLAWRDYLLKANARVTICRVIHEVYSEKSYSAWSRCTATHVPKGHALDRGGDRGPLCSHVFASCSIRGTFALPFVRSFHAIIAHDVVGCITQRQSRRC